MTAPIAVIVTTKGEELHVRRCHESVTGLGLGLAAVIYVLSSDRTRGNGR